MADWEKCLPKIAAMKFNWIYLNPIQASGFSGSLYSIKDYYQLRPLFQGNNRERPDKLLQEFVQKSEQQNLSVMMDLVINHTAKDSPLVSQHPQWYYHETDGSVRSPFVVDPSDSNKITVWGDLAEINYQSNPERENLLSYWKKLLAHYIQLGFHGFRCDAAYKIPGDVWAELIEFARQINPEIRFLLKL